MNRPRRLLPALLLLLATAAALLFLLLPTLANRFLLPRLLVGLPLAGTTAEISWFSPFRLSGRLHLDGQMNASNPGSTLSLPAFTLLYHPAGLLKGRIDELRLDAATLHLELVDGQPVFPLPATSRAAGGQATDDQATDDPAAIPPGLFFPLAIETIRLENSTLLLHREPAPPLLLRLQGRIDLDFLDRTDGGNRFTSLQGEMALSGAVRGNASCQVESGAAGHHLALLLDLPDIAEVAELVGELTAGSDLDSTTGWQGPLPLGAASLQGELVLDEQFRLGDFRLGMAVADFNWQNTPLAPLLHLQSEVGTPLRLELSGRSSGSTWQLTGLHLQRPERAAISLNGEVDFAGGRFTATGRVEPATGAAAIDLTLAGHRQGEGGELTGSLHQGSYALTGVGGRPGHPGQLEVGTLHGKASLTIAEGGGQGRLHLTLDNLAARQWNTSLHGLELTLPLRFPLPPPAEAAAGELRVAEIHHQGVASGSLRAAIRPSREGVAFTTHLSTFQPQWKLGCSGTASLTGDLELTCTLPESALTDSDLPPFLPLPEGLIFTARVAGEGSFRRQLGIPAGQLRLQVRADTLNFEGNAATDLACEVTFPRLPLLESAPSQLCSSATLSLGRLQFAQARLRFRLEEPTALFVESARLGWCQGSVETGGFRLLPDQPELATTLYCDRLNFAELLNQFGVADAEGEGSVNGRLPLIFGDRGPSFTDGFLFSTPGNGGIVRFTDTSQLQAGMPPMAETATLAYTLRALEDFSYNWAKVSLNSRGDELQVGLQLDGKPSAPLPFRAVGGQIVAGGEGARLQHPIRLDVNFRLPMQEMWRHGKNIQSFMEQ